MSISTTTNRWSYVGNGVTTAFAYTNKILASTDLKVYLETIADGTLTLQTETTHYTVSGAGAAAGGNVNFVTAPSSSYNVVIVREVPYTQPAEFDPRKQQSPSGTEDAFDRATVLVQQVLDRLGRTIGLANGKSSPASLNGLTGDLASKYLGFDADEQPVALDAPANTTAVSSYMAALLLTASEAAFKAAANLEAGTDFLAPAGDGSALTGIAIGHGMALSNGKLVWSVGSSALTVAVKTLAGNDPSASDPVKVAIPDGSGGVNVRSITAALSLVISNGSTLGTTNSTAFRIWIGALDNGGTVELFAVNCRSGLSILPLDEDGTITTTAEGGAGGADSAQVPYSASARTNKQFRVLGYGTWNSGLGTAGTWSAGPSLAVLRGPSTKLPGDVVQQVFFTDGATATTTTELPIDDSIPQSGEGAQWTSQSITPKAAANLLDIEVSAQIGGQTLAAIALFQDATAGALAAAAGNTNTTSPRTVTHHLRHRMLAGTTSATAMKVRFGGVTGNTLAINGGASGRIFGGVSASTMVIRELQG